MRGESTPIANPAGVEVTMFNGRTSAAVFIPPAASTQRTGYSEKRLQLSTRLRVRARIRVDKASSPSGHRMGLRLTGGLWLRSPQARFVFRQAEDDGSARSAPVVAEVPLLPLDTAIRMPARLVECDHATPPFVWVAFVDGRRELLLDAICMGRVRQEGFELEPSFDLPVLATAWVAARRLDRRGPVVGLSGEFVIPHGLKLQLAVATVCDRVGAPTRDSEVVEFAIADAGTALAFPSHIVATEAPDHPLVALSLRDWNGRDDPGETAVGRVTRLQ